MCSRQVSSTFQNRLISLPQEPPRCTAAVPRHGRPDHRKCCRAQTFEDPLPDQYSAILAVDHVRWWLSAHSPASMRWHFHSCRGGEPHSFSFNLIEEGLHAENIFEPQGTLLLVTKVTDGFYNNYQNLNHWVRITYLQQVHRTSPGYYKR
jgi:hypothetical protein